MYSAKKLIKSSNIFDAIKPFYYLSKILGTAPFTVNVENNIVRMETTTTDYLIYLIFNIFHSCLLYYFTVGVTNSSLFQTSSSISNYGQNIMLMITNTSAVIFNLINFLFKSRTMEIISEFIKIDLQMSLLYIEVDHKAQSKIIKKYIILCFLLVFILTVMTGSIYILTSSSENLLIDLSISLSLILTNIFYANVVSQFIMALLSSYARFKKLNDGFSEIFNSKSNESQDLSDIVKRISKIHDNLIENVERINYRFAAWIMIIFASVFILSTISIFTFVRALIIFEKKPLIMALPRFIWSSYFIMFLLMVIAAGSATTRIVFTFYNFHEIVIFI